VRCSPIFEYAPNVLIIVTIFGGLTAFFAATTGAFQNDLKRVIAYSTCSQLGYMVFACGISAYSVSMFHLMNHAFFKALLFLSAGSIIHAMNDEQDMRKLGALNRILPFTYTMTLIGSLALIGFPFLTGFYSKDFILEIASAKMNFSGNFAYWLGTISVSFTTFYSYRLVYLSYLNRTNAYKNAVVNAHESDAAMSIPLIVLAFGSLFVGYATKDMIIGLGSSFWGNSIFILSKNISFLEAEYLPYTIKLIPFVFSHFGVFVAYHTSFILSGSVKKSSSLSNIDLSFHKNVILFDWFFSNPLYLKIYTYFNQKWHFDDLYHRFIVQKFLDFGHHISFKLIDNGWIAYLGPYGLGRAVQNFSYQFGKLQSGYVYHYAFIILASVTFFVVLVFLFSFDLDFLNLSSLESLFFILGLSFWFITNKKLRV
jgi:NADH-ubiquinone oxidoreductase chain 5